MVCDKGVLWGEIEMGDSYVILRRMQKRRDDFYVCNRIISRLYFNEKCIIVEQIKDKAVFKKWKDEPF